MNLNEIYLPTTFIMIMNDMSECDRLYSKLLYRIKRVRVGVFSSTTRQIIEIAIYNELTNIRS